MSLAMVTNRDYAVAASVIACWLMLVPAVASAQECAPDNQFVYTYQSAMAPKSVSDIFGKRIAKRYVAIQVTITNRCDDFDYVLHDVSLDLSKVFSAKQRDMLGLSASRANGARFELSSQELTLMRGVAEKGQVLDTRNLTVRILRAIGTIAGGLVGLNLFGSTFPEGVAVYNGPVITAFVEAFPDFTVNQLIRLNDSAFVANAVIPRKKSKVVVAFLPQELLMDKAQRKTFWNEPTAILPDLRLLEVGTIVDGNFVVEVVKTVPAVDSGVFVEDSEMKKFQDATPEVQGSIFGYLLADARVALLNAPVQGVSIELLPSSTEKRLDFVIRSKSPLPSATVLEIGVAKDDHLLKTTLTVK